MAKNETRRLAPGVIRTDKDAFAALLQISDYTPANQDYAAENGQTLRDALQQAQDVEYQADAAFKAARDNAAMAEWTFHNFMLGVKDQVRAQYGIASNELQGLGLKKKTEYKSPHPARKP